MFSVCFFFQAEDGIRDLVRSRGLGDVYKRQPFDFFPRAAAALLALCAVALAPLAWAGAQVEEQLLSLIHI